MAKKETEKKATKKSTAKAEPNETEVKINAETIDPKKIAEAIENIDTKIDLEPIEKEIEEKMEKAMEPINEITEKLNDLNESQQILASKIQKEPENAKELIESEIEKAKELQKKTIEKINSTNRRRDITSWWNGIGYSM